MRKWTDKYDMVSKELKQKESALHRVEVELDRTRNDLERTKQNAEKAGLSAKMYEDKIAASNREIEGWKEKQMRTHAEVNEVQLRFDQGGNSIDISLFAFWTIFGRVVEFAIWIFKQLIIFQNPYLWGHFWTISKVY